MLLNAYGEAVRNRALRITDEIAGALDEVSRAGKRHQTVERNAATNLLLNGRGLMLLISVSELRNLLAAAHVGLSQAGASMSLSRMETALGQPLFQRMMQGMVTTDVGARIISSGKRIVAELRHMQSDIAAIAGTTQGSVTIGALPLGRTYVLPTAIAAALRRHPNIRVTTVESPYEVLVAGLRDGDLDFIFGALRFDVKSAGLVTESLFKDRLGIIVRAGHPLAEAPVSLKDLLPQRWILPKPGAPGRRLIDLSFHELAIEPPVPSVDPPEVMSLSWIAGAIELVGGALLASGLFTRPVAFVLSGEMAFAYWIGHAPRIFFPVLNGGDAAILYCFVFLYLAFAGAGPWSLDALRSEKANRFPAGGA